MMTNRLLLGAVAGLYLATIACGNKTEFDGEIARDILQAGPIKLDVEQVTITQMQLSCGVQSELWDSPAQISQDRTAARLTSQGRELNFTDDPVTEPSFHQPYAQVRGSFLLQMEDASSVRDGEEKGTKVVDAKVGIKIPHTCFPNPVPLMGVKRGNFREDTPPSFLFRLAGDGWHFEKVIH
jgi:hypothetical protein